MALINELLLLIFPTKIELVLKIFIEDRKSRQTCSGQAPRLGRKPAASEIYTWAGLYGTLDIGHF